MTTDTEKLLRDIVKRRSELELIYYTTVNEDIKNNCEILIDFLYKRYYELEKKLEKDKKDLPWYSNLLF